MSVFKRVATVIGVGACVLIGLAFAGLAFMQSHMQTLYGRHVERIEPLFEEPAPAVAILDVSILSPDGATMIAGQTVILRDGLIDEIGPGLTPPASAEVIDGEGLFLIPGLVDGHVHLRQQPNDLLLYLANGITHIREFSGGPEILGWRDEIERGRVGPRISVSTPPFFTAGALDAAFIRLTRPRERVTDAEEAVERAVLRDFDAIKLYDNIDVAVFEAVTARARALGVHTVGHLPSAYQLDALETTNLREIAHIEEFYKLLRREFSEIGEFDEFDRFLAYLDERAPEIVEDLIARDVSVNTTIYFMDLMRPMVYELDATLRSVPLEYANPAMVEGSPFAPFGWLPGRNRFAANREDDPAGRAQGEAFWRMREEAQRALLRHLDEGGVRLIAGTDATVELVIPGFSLHAELEALVAHGLSPAESLRAATANPAALTGDNAGVIAPGRRADLVLLAADPLADIRHTRRIETVIIGGVVHDRDALDAMLSAVIEAHARSRNFDLSLYQ